MRESKVSVEQMICGLMLLAFAITGAYPFILLVIIVCLFVILVLPFSNTLCLLFFLIPSLDAFSHTPYMAMSLATVIYVAAFARYLLTQVPKTSFYLPGLWITAIVFSFEIAHILYSPAVLSTQTVRWSVLFIFASLLLFDLRIYAEFKVIRKAFLWGLIFSTLFGLFAKVFGISNETGALAKRFAGAAGDPNNFGMYCLLVVYFYLPSIPREAISAKNMMIVTAILLIGTMTVSRTYFIVSAATVMVYSVFYFSSALDSLAYKLVKVSCLLFFCFVFFEFSGQADVMDLGIMNRFNGSNLSQLTGARSDIFSEYIEHFQNLPIYFVMFGAGINGYLVYYNDLFQQNSTFELVVGPHNTVLESLLSFGVLGSLLLVAYMVIALKSSRVRQDNIKAFRLAFIPLLVFLTYFMSLQNLAKYNTYFLLFIIAYSCYRERQIK